MEVCESYRLSGAVVAQVEAKAKKKRQTLTLFAKTILRILIDGAARASRLCYTQTNAPCRSR